MGKGLILDSTQGFVEMNLINEGLSLFQELRLKTVKTYPQMVTCSVHCQQTHFQEILYDLSAYKPPSHYHWLGSVV